jgi:hypothetical protein
MSLQDVLDASMGEAKKAYEEEKKKVLVQQEQGVKYDANKARPDLIDDAWCRWILESQYDDGIRSLVMADSVEDWQMATTLVVETYPNAYHALTDVAKVLEFGCKKYAENNWRKGFERKRLVAAALRHWNAWRGGELVAADSGLDHRAHFLCNMMFMWCLHGQKENVDG